MGEFEHRKLRVYHAALEANDGVLSLLRGWGRNGSLEDQLERAAESVVLNIAEGAGEFSPADKARFYRIALRSCSETAAALDLLRQRDIRVAEASEKIQHQLSTVSAMLVRLIQVTKSRPKR